MALERCSDVHGSRSSAPVMAPDVCRDGCRCWPDANNNRNRESHDWVGGLQTRYGCVLRRILLKVASHRLLSRLYADVILSDIRLLTIDSLFVSNRVFPALLTNRSLR